MRSLRKTPLKRSQKPIKKRPRSKSEFARIYGSKERVEWVKSLPCAACGVVGYSENAHIETGGMGRKADFTKIVPLCGLRPLFPSGVFICGCHTILHTIGAEYLGQRWDIDLDVCASSTQQQWMEYSGLTEGTKK